MSLPLQDLNGPQRGEAERIIRCALDMDDKTAQMLAAAWDNSPAALDQIEYLANCKAVWDALEESSRFLPLGWFEAIFADCSWADSTRALHPLADAVCATLVRDLIPESTFHYMVTPWEEVMSISVN